MSDEKDTKDEAPEPEKDLRPEEAKKPSPPSGTVPSADRFRLIAMGVCVVAAAGVAGAIYCAAPTDSFLWKPFAKAGATPIRPMLLPAIAGGLALLWLLLVKLKSRWSWMKPGQGTWVRMSGYGSALFLSVFGGVQIQHELALQGDWFLEVFSTTVLGNNVAFRYAWFPGIAFAALGLLGYHLFMNREKWADFLIETQSELRKVSWPATREWTLSSVVVVLVMMFTSIFLYAADELLSRLMQRLGIGF